MSKYTKDIELLVEYIGGSKNIKAVSHCVTRMRFVLIDPSVANVEAIDKLGSVKGTFTQSGEYNV